MLYSEFHSKGHSHFKVKVNMKTQAFSFFHLSLLEWIMILLVSRPVVDSVSESWIAVFSQNRERLFTWKMNLTPSRLLQVATVFKIRLFKKYFKDLHYKFKRKHFYGAAVTTTSETLNRLTFAGVLSEGVL